MPVVHDAPRSHIGVYGPAAAAGCVESLAHVTTKSPFSMLPPDHVDIHGP